MRRNPSAKKRENHSTRQNYGSGLNDSYLYKAVGRKRKQNLQVSIPKTSRILLVWVCVPAVKLDVA
jgi:hypothetical protein